MEMGRDRDVAGCGPLDGTANRAPWASLSPIRIAGSGVIDRPTFRLPFPDARVGGDGNAEVAPHSPQDGRNASRSS